MASGPEGDEVGDRLLQAEFELGQGPEPAQDGRDLLLDPAHRIAHRKSKLFGLRRAELRYGLRIDLKREQVRTDFIVQVARESRPLVRLRRLELRAQLVVAALKLGKPCRHIVEAARQLTELEGAGARDTRAVVPGGDRHQAGAKLGEKSRCGCGREGHDDHCHDAEEQHDRERVLGRGPDLGDLVARIARQPDQAGIAFQSERDRGRHRRRRNQ